MIAGMVAMLLMTFVLSRLFYYGARRVSEPRRIVFANLVSVLILGGGYLWLSLSEGEGIGQFFVGFGLACVCQLLWYWFDTLKHRDSQRGSP